jgi:hypothetical protein
VSAIAHRPRNSGIDPLIEEARQRARRRRLGSIAACALVAGVLVWALAASIGGTSRTPPRGFVFAQARGPVDHALIEYRSLGWTTLVLATGERRTALSTEEIWYEPKSGLWRDVYRLDGRTKSEQTGWCRPLPKQSPCGGDYPLAYLRPFPWPPARSGLRVTGRGSFEGRPVLWLGASRGLRTGKNVFAVSEFGVDPRTHRVIVVRSVVGGRPSGYVVVSRRGDLPSGTRFLLPARGTVASTPSPTFEPWTGPVFGYGIPAARKALDKAPLWLGPRFHGFVLRSVRSGVYRPRVAQPGARPMRYVRFYYAVEGSLDYAITVDEVGSPRPWFERQGPRPGTFVQSSTSHGSLSRSGLVLRIATDPRRFPLNRRHTLALGRALRPLPEGLRTVPSLYEQ